MYLYTRFELDRYRNKNFILLIEQCDEKPEREIVKLIFLGTISFDTEEI